MAQVTAPMHIHESGSNAWINEAHFPSVSDYSKFYLTNDGVLSRNQPRTGGNRTLAWAQPGPDSRLSFETPPFPDGATLAGPIGASFTASSTTRNLMLIASLEIVRPDASASQLTSGTVLASLSHNDRAKSWIAANGGPARPYGIYTKDRYPRIGKSQRYNFAISPRYAQIPKGSRLRLTITTQTPAANCAPVLGTAPCFPTAPQIASLTGGRFSLYFGGNQNSYINLPLLPLRQQSEK